MMPPINLWNLPRQEWYDSMWLRFNYKPVQNRVVKQSFTTQKQPQQFMRGR